MVKKEIMGYLNLVLTTLERLDNFMIGFIMANMLYLQNSSSEEPPHGL